MTIDPAVSDLWEVYCTAKARAAAPTADKFDHIELQIALEEFAAALVKWMDKTKAVSDAVARRTHGGVTH